MVLWALASLLLISMGGVILTLLGLSSHIGILCFWGAVCLGLCFFSYDKPRFRLGFMIGGAVFLLVFVFFGGELFRDGLGLTLNAVKDLLGTTFSLIYLPSAVSDNANPVWAVTVFLLPLTMVISVIVAYMVLSRGRLVLIFILVFFTVALILAETSPYWPWYVLLSLSLFLLFIARISGIVYDGGSGKALASAGAIVALIVIGLCLLPMSGIFSKGYEKPSAFVSAEEQFVDFADQVRWGSDCTNNLPEGQFENVNPLELSEKEALEVTMSNPSSLYLRGYVGSVYTSKGWDSVDKERLYSYADLFYWLHDSGFYGTSQLSVASGIAGTDGEEITVSVRNLNAKSKYIYTPYEYKSSDVGKAPGRIGDVAPKAADYEDSENITYTISSNQVKTAAELGKTLRNLALSGNQEAISYLNAENAYRTYVYDTSLNIPKSLFSVFKTHFGEVDLSSGHVDYDDAMQAILDELLGGVTYNEEVSAPEDDGDFCRSFLETEGEGYSVHYATAAAMMFRYFGIPARYVEGYIITPDDVLGVENDEPIILTGKNAHAWVEYYRDGVGWIPFEATPPYLFVMEQPDQMKALVSDTLDSKSDQQGMVNMENDNYEDLAEPETGHDKEETTPVWVYVLFGFVLVFLILVLAMLILWLIRRRVLKKRKREVTTADDRLAVNLLFRHTLILFYSGGLEQRNGSLEYCTEELKVLGEENLSVMFGMIMKLHREAIFSDHDISSYRRHVFALFHKEAKRFAEDHSSYRKRWLDKYIRHLY